MFKIDWNKLHTKCKKIGCSYLVTANMIEHRLAHCATKYQVGPYLLIRKHKSKDIWCVHDGVAYVSTVNLLWVYEPKATVRSLDFIKRTRFTLDQAYSIVKEHILKDHKKRIKE